MNTFLVRIFGVLFFTLACGGDQPAEDVVAGQNGQTLEIAETEEYVLPVADFYMTVSDSCQFPPHIPPPSFGQSTPPVFA